VPNHVVTRAYIGLHITHEYIQTCVSTYTCMQTEATYIDVA